MQSEIIKIKRISNMKLKNQFKKVQLALFMCVLAVSTVTSIAQHKVDAGQITSRSVSMTDNRIYPGSGSVGDAVAYTFTFTPTASTIGSMQFDFCTTALGACTPWNGSATTGPATFTSSSISGFAFGTRTASQMRITRAAAAVTATQQNVVLSALRNPTCGTNNCTFFVRMTTFSDIAYGTPVDSGTVAASVQTAMNVSFRVQETLDFCVGTLRETASGLGGGSVVTNAAFNSTNFTTSNLSTCAGSGLGSPNIDLGIASFGTVRTSPVPVSTTEGSENYGIAMLSTNATNGSVVGYRSVRDAASGELKVAAATCNANPSTITTDQCINSAGSAGNSAAIGTASTTEAFGMTIPTKNSTSSSRATNVLTTATNYLGSGAGTGGACTTGNVGTDCWYWNQTAGGDTIATASSPVDYEALMIKFAAKAAITTPPGQYLINIDYYAVPTF
jgi:hypothetical protein